MGKGEKGKCVWWAELRWGIDKGVSPMTRHLVSGEAAGGLRATIRRRLHRTALGSTSDV